MSANIFVFEDSVPDDLSGKRLDQVLATLCESHSRARLASWIKSGNVTVEQRIVLQPKEKVLAGQKIKLEAELKTLVTPQAEPIALDIIFEDDSVLVLNKPDKLIVHPGAGNPQGTMMNALLHHHPALETVPRAGIVHRLDKGTTGLLMVAKTLTAHTKLVAQLESRAVRRIYQAIVQGNLRRHAGQVDAPIGRHPQHRTKMAVVPNGKPAVTHYECLAQSSNYTHLKIRLETGRTHQIRVHMAHIGHALLGDDTYQGRSRYPAGLTPVQRAAVDDFHRPALHAAALGFEHPETGQAMDFSIDPPEDFTQMLDCLGMPV